MPSKRQTRPTRIGIVDSHPAAREGLSLVLQGMASLEVVVSVSTVEQVFEFLGADGVEVLFLDISSANRNDVSALRAIAALKDLSPTLRIIMLTDAESDRHAITALSYGACGYLLKTCSRYQIQAAVSAILNNVSVIAPKTVLAQLLGVRQRPSQPEYKPILTDRERQIMEMVAKGLSNKEIGSLVHLTECTVKKYCHNAMGKLGRRSRGAAAIEAIRCGAISLRPENESALGSNETLDRRKTLLG